MSILHTAINISLFPYKSLCKMRNFIFKLNTQVIAHFQWMLILFSTFKLKRYLYDDIHLDVMYKIRTSVTRQSSKLCTITMVTTSLAAYNYHGHSLPSYVHYLLGGPHRWRPGWSRPQSTEWLRSTAAWRSRQTAVCRTSPTQELS